MRRRMAHGLTALAIGCLLGAGIQAQESFQLGSKVSSPDFPNLNTEMIIQGDVGAMFEFTADLTLTSAGLEGPEGPQGWSLGFQNTGVDIVSTTYAGTVSANKADGGLEQGGFVQQELIEPARNAGKMGMVQAVVLSFRLPVSLPINSEQVVVKNVYKATIADAPVEATLMYEILRGSGEPVENILTFKGQSRIPTLVPKTITIRKVVGPGPEQGNCNDGVDNDQDTKIDCADEDCDADPVFCPKPEAGSCGDGVDNDKDTKIDCLDEDCDADPVLCPKPENVPPASCNDQKDNDKDGQTDCADADCVGIPPCPVVAGPRFDFILSADGATREGLKNVLETPCGPGAVFIAVASIEKTQDAEPVGAQGWSMGVTHDKDKLDMEVSADFPTLQGTDAATITSQGFDQTEFADPAKNGGKAGFISAVVLSFRKPVTLDPAKNQTIARSKYTVKAEGAGFPTTIMFMTNMRGSGEPVENIITVGGKSVIPTREIPLEVRCGIVPPTEAFLRGNANDDSKVNIADPIWIINELLRQGPATACQDAADANDDGKMDLSDAAFLIDWRFRGGSAPPAPFPGCGDDPTADTLSCPQGSTDNCP